MPRGFKRGNTTGMNDPGGGEVTAVHIRELQENVRNLEERLAALEARPQAEPEARTEKRPIRFEAGPGIDIQQSLRRVWIGSLARTAELMEFVSDVWKLFQEEADVPGLLVSMVRGVVVSTNATTGNPVISFVTTAKINATDDDTTIVWLKASVEAVTFGPIFKVWGVTALVVESGSTLPADTLDISAGTDGDIFFEIGQIDAEDGAVTEIRQTLSEPLPLVFPIGIYGPPTGDYVLVSEDGVVSWAEAGPFACPPPP